MILFAAGFLTAIVLIAVVAWFAMNNFCPFK